MRREVPEPWASAMLAQGFEYAKRPSMRSLARAAGIPSSETVRQMIYGESDPGIATTDAVADALQVARARVGQWVGQARSASRPWDVPAEIELLSPAELNAITDLIRAIAATRQRLPRQPDFITRNVSGDVTHLFDVKSDSSHRFTVDEAALEENPDGTPPGQSEEPET